MDHRGPLWVLAISWLAIFILGDRTRYRARLVMLMGFPGKRQATTRGYQAPLNSGKAYWMRLVSGCSEN